MIHVDTDSTTAQNDNDQQWLMVIHADETHADFITNNPMYCVGPSAVGAVAFIAWETAGGDIAQVTGWYVSRL